jgi:hypothetical protein
MLNILLFVDIDFSLEIYFEIMPAWAGDDKKRLL